MAEPTVITVQGEYSAWYPAERATVAAGIHCWGPDRQAVVDEALASSEAVRSLIEALVDENAGPVTWWSSDSVRVWSERPWNNEGKQLDPVFHASVDFSVKFADFDALARWVEEVAAIPNATVGPIEWSLTDATRTSVTTEVRSRAVQDAVSKATVFAHSIGLSTVTATALADPGMLGNQAGSNPAPAPMYRAAMKASFDSAGGAPQLSLKPEEISVGCAVDARFVAS